MTPRKLVAIVCAHHHGNMRVMAGAQLRYIVIDDSAWIDDPTWADYRRLLARYPGLKTHIVFADCWAHQMKLL